MLLELSKKDKLWRKHAYRYCKCKQLADDIVQEMYLRLHRNPKDKLTEYYVVLTIKSVWLNYLKTKKQNLSIEKLYYLEYKENIFEVDDDEQILLEKYKKLDWKQQELIQLRYDYSLKQIQEKYPMINYGYAHRLITSGIKEILGDSFDEKYNNTRLKNDRAKR